MILIHNILLIDDDEMDNYIAKQLLKRNRISDDLTIKTSAMEGLAYLDELKRTSKYFPEIILLDINMPGMDGFAFLNQFSHYPSKLTAKCCIFILSSSHDQKDIQKARQYPFVKDYIVKPLTKDKIESIADTFVSVLNH